jgi:hypothetical protein
MATRKRRYTIWHFQNALIYFIIAFIISGECLGVTVGEEKTLCPVCEKEITVLRVGSFGSYIFERKSKYDLIYFPKREKKVKRLSIYNMGASFTK